MCACDWDFICNACKDTPQDGRYFLDEQDEREHEPPRRESDGSWQAWA